MDQFRCSHTLNKTGPLPSKEVTLRVTKTKVQLTEIVKADLMENLPVFSNKFIITSKQDIPEQLHFGRQSERHDLITTQEEADVIIPRQVLAAITDGKSSKTFVVKTQMFLFYCATLITSSNGKLNCSWKVLKKEIMYSQSKILLKSTLISFLRSCPCMQ